MEIPILIYAENLTDIGKEFIHQMD